MQVSETTTLSSPSREIIIPHKVGTIPVTVRLDPPRYDRLKRLVRRFSTTGQNIIQGALDRSMASLERKRTPSAPEGQTSLFMESTETPTRRAWQPRFDFERPEPTIPLTYRASVPMHRWLRRRSLETGKTIQQLIDEALKVAKGDD